MILIKTNMLEGHLAKRLSAILTGDSAEAYKEYPSRINRWVIAFWYFRCNEKNVYALWQQDETEPGAEVKDGDKPIDRTFQAALAKTIAGLIGGVKEATVIGTETEELL